MKFLITLALVTLSTTHAFAGHEVIGETKECPIQTKVLQKTVKGKSSLLVIHERDVYELPLTRQSGSMKFYASSYQAEASDRIMTFEAAIMGPEMSRLSELTIRLSGVSMDCLIDK